MCCLEEKKLILSSDKIDQLKQQWSNDQYLMLAINDCLHASCLLKDKCILHNNAENLALFDHKLMELFLLLAVWAQNEPELLASHTDNLFQHAKNQKKKKTKI